MFALLSVSDKTGLVELAVKLIDAKYNLLATGGTLKKLQTSKALGNVQHAIFSVESVTKFPEILGGRVKTLHPLISGGILFDRDNKDHVLEAQKHNIPDIRVVVVNLYPFWTLDHNTVKDQDAIEQIDIGGVTLLRAAAKNFKDVSILSDPLQYGSFNPNSSLEARRELARSAFNVTEQYDLVISRYFGKAYSSELKYGCNPHQSPAMMYPICGEKPKLRLLNGQWGYINVLDAINAWSVVSEIHSMFPEFTVASSFKHTNPAGVAISKFWHELTEPSQKLLEKLYGLSEDTPPSVNAYARARNADPQASFGDFIGFHGIVDEALAEFISKQISDGIVAQGYQPAALEILKKKKKGSFVIIEADPINFERDPEEEFREFRSFGFALSQPMNLRKVTAYEIVKNVPTNRKHIPANSAIDLIIANAAMKYAQSNNVACAAQGQLIACASGQQSRIGAVQLVSKKAKTWICRHQPELISILDTFDGTRQEKIMQTTKLAECYSIVKDPYNLVGHISLASDGFFPFSDNIEAAAKIPVNFISQPGGSTRDQDVIKKCDEYNIAMAMTGVRIFTH